MRNILKNRSFLIDLFMICSLLFMLILVLYFLYLRTPLDNENPQHRGHHLLVLTPNVEDQLKECQAEMAPIIEKYDLQVEFMPLSTIADQKQMLSLVPISDIDGVLFWPISISSHDYSTELTACQGASIPIVLIDHDFDDKTLRNSFLGSGFNSELMILNQTLMEEDHNLPIIIGGYSSASDGEMYELLIFQKDISSPFDVSQIQSDRLRSFVNSPPNHYYASDYIRVTSPSNDITALNATLYQSLQNPAGLTFSLDETLTTALAIGLENGALQKSTLGTFIGYKRDITAGKLPEQSVVDKLLISDVPRSAMIGLRYLNDILRDFWVPSTFDSGVKLITQ